jgi:hypothetical protein
MRDSIALIQCSEMHTEVFGGLINLFGKNCKNLYIYYVPYKSDFVKYYTDQSITCTPIHLYKIKDGKDKLLRTIDHDLFVFVTGREYDEQTDPTKTLLLMHHTDERVGLTQMGTLGVFSISPLCKKLPHFLTVYKPCDSSRYIPNKFFTLLFCGYTNPDNKDLKSLVKLLEHIKQNDLPIKVNIVNYYPIKELEEYQKESICKVHVDLPAKKMMKLVHDADYVLTLVKKNSSYHKYQLTGVIPLAVSLGTPLIIDKDLADIYGFSQKNCVIYESRCFKNAVLEEFERFKIQPSRRPLEMLKYRDYIIKMYQQKMKKFLKDL